MNNWGSVFKNIKPGKKTALAGIVAASISLGAPMTLMNEGMKLKPYYDSVGVLTWCGGETEVGYKESFTKEECADLFYMRYGYYSYATAEFYNDKAEEVITPKIHAALTDMSYNVGLPTVKKSSMIRELNAGHPVAACNAILKYKFAGGRDCSAPGNKSCPGVWTRRQQIHKLCIEGVSRVSQD